MNLTILLIFAAHCALIGGGLARFLGRNPASWAVGCFVTGTFGIALLWFLGRSDEVEYGYNPEAWKRWLTATVVDQDIAATHDQVFEKCGLKGVKELAERFHYAGDKASLPALVDLVRRRYDPQLIREAMAAKKKPGSLQSAGS